MIFQSASRVILIMTLALIFFCKLVSSSSIFAWDGVRPRGQPSELESMSGLLTTRGGSEIQSLVNAKRIIQDLSSSPSCAYEPTARLLRQCKLIKPTTSGADADQQKSNVQATYGITMALCEARQARIRIPKECSTFEAMLEHKVPDSSVAISASRDIENCMNALFETSSWTTYITFRAKSSDLCDASRVDYQREELLETFREATNVVPEVLQALREHQYESEATMAGVREMVTEVAETQQDLLRSNHDQMQQSREYLHQMSQYVDTYMQTVQDSSKSWQTNMQDAVGQAVNDLALMNDKTAGVHANFAELYATAAEALSGMTYNFETSVEAMTKEANFFVEKLFEINMDDHMAKMQQGLSLGQAAATQFARTQFEQQRMAQEQLTTSHDLLQVIKDSHGQFHQIKQTLDLIPGSFIDKLHQAQRLVARAKNEFKYGMLVVVPSLLLLLFGRLRIAAITTLLYAFARLAWSSMHTLSLPLSAVPISAEDLKLLAFCSVGAVCAGGSFAFVGSLFFSYLAKRKIRRRLRDAEVGPVRVHRRCLSTSSPVRPKFETVPRRSRSSEKTPDRFSRAETCPPDIF